MNNHLLAAVACLGVFAFGVGGAQAGGVRCKVEYTTRSPVSNAPTFIVFANDTSAPIRVFWLDYKGDRKFYASIAPGRQVKQNTYVGHVWVVTDADENCIELDDGESPAQTVHIQP